MRTKEELSAYLDAVIRENENGEITGPIMNSALKEIITALAKGVMKVPTETLTEDYIGKVCEITSGSAVICSHTPGSEGENAVPGIWSLHFGSSMSSGAGSSISFRLNDIATVIEPANWNNATAPYPSPTSITQELTNLEAFFNNMPNVEASLAAAEPILTVGEVVGGTGSNLSITGWTDASVTIEQEPQDPVAPGTPYLEKIPAGILVGVQDGEAYISIDTIQYVNIPGGVDQGQKVYVGNDGSITTQYHSGWCFGYALSTTSEETLCPILYRPEYFEE